MRRAALVLTALTTIGLFAACGGGETQPQNPKPAQTGTAAMPDDPNVKHDTSLDAESNQVCEVLIDGKSVGKTPLLGFKLAPGHHDITFVDSDGDRRTIGVELVEGDHKSLRSDVPPKIREQADPKKK